MAVEKKCSEVRELLSPYLEKDLNSSEMELLSLHLEGCPDCRRELELLQKTVGILKELPQEPPPTEILKGVKDVIYRKPVWTLWWETIKGSNWTRPLAQAAAVVIVVASIIIVQQRYPGLKKEGTRITRPRLIPGEPEISKPSMTDETAPAMVPDKAPADAKKTEPGKDVPASVETDVVRPIQVTDRAATPEIEITEAGDAGITTPPPREEHVPEKTSPLEIPIMESAEGKKPVMKPVPAQKNEAAGSRPSTILKETSSLGLSKEAKDKLPEPAASPADVAELEKTAPSDLDEGKRSRAVSTVVTEPLAEGEAAVDSALPPAAPESGRQGLEREEKFRIMEEKEPSPTETLSGGKEIGTDEPSLRMPGTFERLTPKEDSRMSESVRGKSVARLKRGAEPGISKKSLPAKREPEDAYFQKTPADLIILVRAPKGYSYITSLSEYVKKYDGRIENIGPLQKSVYLQSPDLPSHTERDLPFSGSSITLAMPVGRTEEFLRSVAGKTPLIILHRRETAGFRASKSSLYIIQLHVWQPL